MPARNHGSAGVSQSASLPEFPSLQIPVKEPCTECIPGTQDVLNGYGKSGNVFWRPIALMNPATLLTTLLHHYPGSPFQKGVDMLGRISNHPRIC